MTISKEGEKGVINNLTAKEPAAASVSLEETKERDLRAEVHGHASPAGALFSDTLRSIEALRIKNYGRGCDTMARGAHRLAGVRDFRVGGDCHRCHV